MYSFATKDTLSLTLSKLAFVFSLGEHAKKRKLTQQNRYKNLIQIFLTNIESDGAFKIVKMESNDVIRISECHQRKQLESLRKPV